MFNSLYIFFQLFQANSSALCRCLYKGFQIRVKQAGRKFFEPGKGAAGEGRRLRDSSERKLLFIRFLGRVGAVKSSPGQ
jgi:hypothetical protein